MFAVQPSPDRRLTVVGVAGIALVVVFMLYRYWRLQVDDAYILYSIAKNLADGHGWVFNIGERVNAATSPLYTLLLAAFYLLLRPFTAVTLPMIGHALGGIGLFFAALYLMRAFTTAGKTLFPYLLPFVFLANPLLPHAVGMETFLLLMFCLMSLYYYLRDRLVLTGFLCALAVLTRPDAVILAALLAVHYVVTRRRFLPAGALAAFALPVLAWSIFSLTYFGSLVPSTLAAKLAQSEAELWGTGLVFLKSIGICFLWYGTSGTRLLSVGIALAGFIVLIVQWRHWSLTRHPMFRLILIWSLLYLVAYGLILNPPAYFWYYTPLALALALVGTLPFEAVFRLGANLPRPQLSVLAALLFAVVIWADISLPLRLTDPAQADEYAACKEAAEWFNAHAEPDITIGAGDIGVFRFYLERGSVIDAMGLVTPQGIDYIRQGDLEWYIRELRPDYVVFTLRPRAEIDLLVERDWFKRDYEQRTVVTAGNRATGIYRRTTPAG